MLPFLSPSDKSRCIYLSVHWYVEGSGTHESTQNYPITHNSTGPFVHFYDTLRSIALYAYITLTALYSRGDETQLLFNNN